MNKTFNYLNPDETERLRRFASLFAEILDLSVIQDHQIVFIADNFNIDALHCLRILQGRYGNGSGPDCSELVDKFDFGGY